MHNKANTFTYSKHCLVKVYKVNQYIKTKAIVNIPKPIRLIKYHRYCNQTAFCTLFHYLHTRPRNIPSLTEQNKAP